MFALVAFKNKQYKMEIGKEYKIDLTDHEDKENITFSEILLVEGEKGVQVGNPHLAGASVEAEIIKDMKDDKVSGIKFHAKKRYKRNLGHRQQYTVIKVKEIKL